MADQTIFECFECGALNLLETMGYDETTGYWGLCSECGKMIDFKRNELERTGDMDGPIIILGGISSDDLIRAALSGQVDMMREYTRKGE